MPISSGVWRFQPGSVKIGGVWQVAHAALPANSVSPRTAAAPSKLPAGASGAGIAIC